MVLAVDAVVYAGALPALAGAGALSAAVLGVADVVTAVCAVPIDVIVADAPTIAFFSCWCLPLWLFLLFLSAAVLAACTYRVHMFTLNLCLS